MNTAPTRLVVASNRLPVVLTREPGGCWRLEPGKGGLVNALEPLLRRFGGMWIGWPGSVAEQLDHDRVDVDRLLEEASAEMGFRLVGIPLTTEERDNFYHGFSNEVIWPLFHDLPSRTHFEPEYFSAYRRVNHKFAAVIAAELLPGDFLWIHDYHLLDVGEELRRQGIRNRLGFFLHIPFPPLDIFLKLPWRRHFLTSLLAFDLIGLQAQRDRRNFLSCVKAILPQVRIRAAGTVLEDPEGGRTIQVGVFPISIDFERYAQGAQRPEVAAAALSLCTHLTDRKRILGIDRLDYTKGIPERLRAFRLALRRYPELRGRVSLIQVVVPSRVEIPEYADLKQTIEQLVGEINGEFTEPGWVPIHYMYRSLSTTELLALYRSADIALVTPLKDGMNLVCKEYCATNLSETGVLILSEFAGAAEELRPYCHLVNPFNIEDVADAIHAAALTPESERLSRMRALRRYLREHDIYRWLERYLAAARLTLPRGQAQEVEG